jgi:hypothetical protein
MSFVTWRLGLPLLVALGVGGPFASTARAATSPPVSPVFVLEVESDDAEDQAEALTVALRSKVRSTPGWTLAETSQTAGALFLALRCPPKPDAACQTRVGDQLHADRYIWGTMSKASPSLVTVELHLWQRGRAESVARETYTANLSDPGDESLKRVAVKLVERLSGIFTSFLTVQSTTEKGTVYIDGKPFAQLEKGQARVTVAAGAHDVEIRTPGFAPVSQRVDAKAGGEATAAFTMTPAAAEEGEKKGVSARTVVGWSLVGVGAVGIGGAIVEAVRFGSLNSELNELRKNVSSDVKDVCAEEAQQDPDAVLACRKAREATQARDLGIVFGAIGVTAATVGVVLLVTDTSKSDAAPKQARNGWTFQPYASPWSAGMNARLRF